MGIFKKHEKKDETDDEFFYKPLTNQQLSELHMEVMQAGGDDKFLEKMGVVRLDKFGTRCAVRMGEVSGLKVRPEWDINYKSDLLYDTWSKIMQQLEKYRFGLEQQKYRNDPNYKITMMDNVRKKLSGNMKFKSL